MAWPATSARSKNWGTEIFTDADLESELDLLHTYINDMMNASSGHKHDGTTSEGPKILTANIDDSAGAQGDAFYSSGTAITRLAAGTDGQVYRTQGAAANPTWTDLYNLIAAQGDILYGSAATTLAKLAAGTSGHFLKTNGAGSNPAWASATTQVAFLQFTSAASTTTTEAKTGVGFQPDLVVFLCRGQGATPEESFSVGFDDATSKGVVAKNHNGGAEYSTSFSIWTSDSTPSGMQGKINSMDADGFTIGWTRVGGGTVTGSLVTAVCFKFPT